MLKNMHDVISTFFSKEKGMYFSVFLYLLGPIICICTLLLHIVPFTVAFKFMERVAITETISDDTLVLNLAFWGAVVYICVCLVRHILLGNKTIPNKSYEKIAIYAHTAEDFVDLGVSIIVFAFMVSVSIQFYEVETIYVSFKASLIYCFTFYKCIVFLGHYFCARNRTVIENVLKNYAELD